MAQEKKHPYAQLKASHLHRGIIGFVLFPPLVFFPHLIGLYRLPKTVFISLLATVLIWLWLFLLIQEKERRVVFPLAIPIFTYLGISALSLVKAANPFEGVFSFSREATYIFLFWLVVNGVRTREQTDSILLWTLPSAVIVSLIGIYQVFGGEIPGIVNTIAPPGSTFGNKNAAAQYILLSLPMPFLLLLSSTDRQKERLFAICAAIMTTYLVYTGTRAAWLAALVSSMAIFIFLRLKRPSLQTEILVLRARLSAKKRYLAAIVLFVVAMNLISTYLGAGAPRVLERLGTALELEQDMSLRSRLAIWTNTIHMFRDHPLFGVGKGNFKIAYPLYAERGMKDLAFSPAVQIREAHNDYVQLLGEVGIFGFIPFLWILLWLGFKVCRSLPEKADGQRFLQMLALSFSLCALLIVASLDFPFELPVSLSFFWLFAGLLWVTCESTHPLKTEAFWADGAWVLSPKSAKLAVGLLSGFSILFTAVHINLLRAEYYLSRGTIWFYEVREGPWRAAERDLKTAETLNPTSHRPPYTLGLLYLWRERYEEAIKANVRALKHHPNYINAYNNLGVAYASWGNLREAEWAWKKALAIWSDHNEARNNLATVYAAQGKRVQAIALLKESLVRDPEDKAARRRLKKLLTQESKKPD